MKSLQKTLHSWNLWNIEDKELFSLLAGRSGGPTTMRILDLILQMPLNKNQIAKILNLDYKTVEYHINLMTLHDYLFAVPCENIKYLYPSQKLFNSIEQYNLIKEMLQTMSNQRKR